MNLTYDEPLSNCAFDFNLRPCHLGATYANGCWATCADSVFATEATPATAAVTNAKAAVTNASAAVINASSGNRSTNATRAVAAAAAAMEEYAAAATAAYAVEAAERERLAGPTTTPGMCDPAVERFRPDGECIQSW